MPKGWDSDAFRVEKLSGEPYLEVSKQAGVHFVTLPAVSLKGDFVIEGNYFIDLEVQALVIRLESRKTNAFLPVTLLGNGRVAILDDMLVAPTNYKGGPTQFVLKREGKKLRVFLNGDVVGNKRSAGRHRIRDDQSRHERRRFALWDSIQAVLLQGHGTAVAEPYNSGDA